MRRTVATARVLPIQASPIRACFVGPPRWRRSAPMGKEKSGPTPVRASSYTLGPTSCGRVRRKNVNGNTGGPTQGYRKTAGFRLPATHVHRETISDYGGCREHTPLYGPAMCGATPAIPPWFNLRLTVLAIF